MTVYSQKFCSREGDSFVQWFLKTKEIVSAFKNIGARKKERKTHTHKHTHIDIVIKA